MYIIVIASLIKFHSSTIKDRKCVVAQFMHVIILANAVARLSDGTAWGMQQALFRCGQVTYVWGIVIAAAPRTHAGRWTIIGSTPDCERSQQC